MASAAPVPPTLPGVDTAAGLALAQGDPRLYRKMLLRFRAGQADFARRFAEAGQAADPSGQERCAHTLKSTAGTIGARSLQDAASRLLISNEPQPTEYSVGYAAHSWRLRRSGAYVAC